MCPGMDVHHIASHSGLYCSLCSRTSRILFFFLRYGDHRELHSFPTRRSSDLPQGAHEVHVEHLGPHAVLDVLERLLAGRSEEHTSELQSRRDLVCRLLLEKKKQQTG